MLFLLAFYAIAADGAALRSSLGTSDKRWFSYYVNNLTETSSHNNLLQADTIQQANDAWSTFKIPSILLSIDAFLTQGSPGLILRNDWNQAWSAFYAEAEPLLKSGAVIGFNLGDELVWNGLNPNNLTFVADTVRSKCPRGSCIVWYNEAAWMGSGDPHSWHDAFGQQIVNYSIPAALDWFSVDIYHMDGFEQGWVVQYVRSFYEKWIYPNLTSSQSVILIPGSFGSEVNHYPNGTYVCNRSCYDAMCANDAADYTAWATRSPLVAGVFPWTWGGCPTCNGSRWTPPHTCCMDELGTRVMDATARAWRTLAPVIMGRNQSSADTVELTI